MDYGNESLLLRYEIHDLSDFDPCLRLLILKQGNAAVYRTKETRRDEDGPDHVIILSEETMEEVRKILSEDRLYRLRYLEELEVHWDGVHTYNFYLASDGKEAAYSGRELEYVAGTGEGPNTDYAFDVLKRLGDVLIPQGVPAVCFIPAERAAGAPYRSPFPRVIKTFTIYDLREAGMPRMMGDEKHPERLERYAFEKRDDGSFALAVQMGWPGSAGHWDGAGNSFALPEEWFDGSFWAFLVKLTEKYPADSYGYTKEELAGTDGLMEFLGFIDF
jgi:hypothetical protein